jgi:hypothetical protein
MSSVSVGLKRICRAVSDRASNFAESERTLSRVTGSASDGVSWRRKYQDICADQGRG